MHKEVIRLLTHTDYDKVCTVRLDIHRSVKGRGSESCQGWPPALRLLTPCKPISLIRKTETLFQGL